MPEEKVLEKLNTVSTAKRLANMVRKNSCQPCFAPGTHHFSLGRNSTTQTLASVRRYIRLRRRSNFALRSSKFSRCCLFISSSRDYTSKLSMIQRVISLPLLHFYLSFHYLEHSTTVIIDNRCVRLHTRSSQSH